MELKTLRKKLKNFLKNDKIFRYYGMLSEFGFLTFLSNLKEEGSIYMNCNSIISLNKFIDHKDCCCYFLKKSYNVKLVNEDFKWIVATNSADDIIGVYVAD